MESKLMRHKYFLYATEFFAGMSVMAVELGASRLMGAVFQFFPDRMDCHNRRNYDRHGSGQRMGRALSG